jgi:predicted phosphodiesterase
VRILVVSDVHGNWPALEAVAAVPHDAVVCLGDIVGYGPQPAECLRWLRGAGATMVQGNHDRSLAGAMCGLASAGVDAAALGALGTLLRTGRAAGSAVSS